MLGEPDLYVVVDVECHRGDGKFHRNLHFHRSVKYGDVVKIGGVEEIGGSTGALPGGYRTSILVRVSYSGLQTGAVVLLLSSVSREDSHTAEIVDLVRVALTSKTLIHRC